jgi:hypothetical protein
MDAPKNLDIQRRGFGADTREQENMPARERPGTHFMKLIDQVLVNPFRDVSPLFLNPSGTVR